MVTSRTLKLCAILAIALTCGIMMSRLSDGLFAGRRAGFTTETGRVSVLVARKNIDRGTSMREPRDWFTLRDLGPGDVAKNAIEAYQALKEKYLNRSLRRGDYVRPEDLSDSLEAIWLLPGGFRSVDLHLLADDIAGGLRCIDPWCSVVGERVEIIVCSKIGAQDHAPGQLQFEDVLVLDAKQPGETAQDRPETPFLLVTVALPDEDAGYFEQDLPGARIQIIRSR
jgi:hypothetical protein